MLVAWLVLIVVVIVFAVVVVYNLVFPRESRQGYDVRVLCKKGVKTAVVIGGTSERGSDVAMKLRECGYQVIIGSRRESRFLDRSFPGDVSWIYMDTRISSTLSDAFTAIRSRCDSIDLVVNMASIRVPYIIHALTGERNGDDIHLKLTGAYKLDYTGELRMHRRSAPGIESWLFTHVIGLINVGEVCYTHNVHKLITLDSDNEIVKGVITEMQKRDSRVYVEKFDTICSSRLLTQ